MKIFGIAGLVTLMMVGQIHAAPLESNGLNAWAHKLCQEHEESHIDIDTCIFCAKNMHLGIVHPDCKPNRG